MKKMFLPLFLVIAIALTACGGASAAPATAAESTAAPAAESAAQPTPEPTPEAKIAYETTYSSFKLYTDSIGTIWGQTIVEIENTGSESLYLSSAACDVEDANGNLAASQSMLSIFPSAIAPGEKAYIYEENTFDDLDVNAEYTIIPRFKAEKLKVESTRLNITEFTLKADDFDGLKGLGRVENPTDKEVDGFVYVVVILLDAENKPVGQMFTFLDPIPAGEKVGFEVHSLALPDDVNLDTVSDYQVFAYQDVMQF